MKTIPIHECFYTWQGEGTHMGKSAFFIRTYGCPVHCPWCDSAGTWHPNYKPKAITRLTPDKLFERAQQTSCEFVVITGGEPAIHDLSALTTLFAQASIPVHIETCGAFHLQGHFDWITLSPKWQAMPLTENLDRADEIKLIVEDTQSINKWIQAIPTLLIKKTVWLHPEWSQHNNPEILRVISETVKTRGAPFRAGYQLHKLYNVDALDANTAPISPLGGNVTLGY